MKNHANRRSVGMKTFVAMLALVLVIGCAVGGTVAWLTAQTDSVVNTFTTSDIKVKLEENTGTEYKMIPGYTISKDPKATVLSGSEECYLFVKLDESTNFKNYMTYEMDEGWTVVPGETNVYYRVVDGTNNKIGTPYSVLKNNQVTVKDSVTKEQMNALDNGTAANPTLTVTAYASQLYKNATETFSAAKAWENVNPTTNP